MMRIRIEYESGLMEVLSTEGEAALSSDVLAAAELAAGATKSAATLFRVRLDRLEQEGLVIEIWWYSTRPDDQWVSDAEMGGRMERLHNLGLERGRSWVILGREDLEGVRLIEIDTHCRLRKRAGHFVNETRFEEQLAYWFGKGLDDQSSFEKARALHDIISRHHPDWTAEQVAESYGYPIRLWLSVAEDEKEGTQEISDESLVERLTDELACLLAENPSLSPREAHTLLLRDGDPDGLPFARIEQVWDVAAGFAGIVGDDLGEDELAELFSDARTHAAELDLLDQEFDEEIAEREDGD